MNECKFLPPANEVCEGYVFTGVCLSTGWGRAWWGEGVCGGGGMHGRGVCMAEGVHGRGHVRQGGVHGRTCMLPSTPWLKLRNTLNEQAVRILLECILVINRKTWIVSVNS